MDEKSWNKIEELRAEYRRPRVVAPLKTLMFWAAEEVDGDLRVMKLDTSQARKAWIAKDKERRFKISSAEAKKIMITQLDAHGWSAKHSVIERRGLPYMGNIFIYSQYKEYVTDASDPAI